MSTFPQPDPMRQLQLAGCLVVALLIFSVCLLPFLLLDLAQTALTNLHLSPSVAILVIIGILMGSAINLPIAVIPLDHEVTVPVYQPVGPWVPFPRFERLQKESVVAVNVGGCVIPVLLGIWMLRYLVMGGSTVIAVTSIGIALNTLLCYRMAQPIPRLGIRLPFLLPAAVALLVTWLGLNDERFEVYHAPAAFVIGICGPLIGADLLHWKDFKTIATGTVSIGGAGTWDGIVLSGLLAALFA